MYHKFDTQFLEPFYDDQVGIRVVGKMPSLLKNFLLTISYLPMMFIPWIFLLPKRWKRNSLTSFSENCAFFGFILVWLLSIIIMSSTVSRFSERYLLPVIPLTAVGMAWVLAKNDLAVISKGVKLWTWIFLLSTSCCI